MFLPASYLWEASKCILLNAYISLLSVLYLLEYKSRDSFRRHWNFLQNTLCIIGNIICHQCQAGCNLPFLLQRNHGVVMSIEDWICVFCIPTWSLYFLLNTNIFLKKVRYCLLTQHDLY